MRLSVESGVVAALAFTALWPVSAHSAGPGPSTEQFRAAGCLIATPDGFVMAINRLLNRLQLPAGGPIGPEAPRETAARETREETGIDVEVGDIALRLDGGRVLLFHCAPAAPVDFRNLTPLDRVEVSRALVVNPVTLRTPSGEEIDARWRFPDTRWLLSAVFRSIARQRAD